MFWRFGGYANISTIDTILDKPEFTLEELLDESDLIQELKQHNTKLIEYLREDLVLEKLLEYVVAPKLEVVEAPEEPADDEAKGKSRLLPLSRSRASSRATDVTDTDDDEQEKRRNRYALVACEVLSSDTWSIYEALTENRELVRSFWVFLSRPAPLDPLQASYFTKVNESLFEKKTEDMMELLRSLPNVVSDLLKHVECPMVMDLLLKVIALDRTEGGQGIVEVCVPLPSSPRTSLTSVFHPVALFQGHHPHAPVVPRSQTQLGRADRCRRLHQGHHHHLCQRLPERAAVHWPQRTNPAARVQALRRAAHQLHAWRRKPADCRRRHSY